MLLYTLFLGKEGVVICCALQTILPDVTDKSTEYEELKAKRHSLGVEHFLHYYWSLL